MAKTAQELQVDIDNRTEEIDNIQRDINNYDEIISVLPAVLPAELQQYVTSKLDTLYATLSESDLLLVADFQYRQQNVNRRLEALIQQRQIQLLIDALTVQLAAA